MKSGKPLYLMHRAISRVTTSRAVADPVPDVTPLFRGCALQVTGQRLPGPVSVVTPPSFAYTLVIALLCVTLLSLSLYLIEIPLRSRAVGVLMPSGGVLDVASSVQGRVSDIAVSEGEVVVHGQSLLTVSSDRGSTSIPSLASSQLRSLQNELDIVSRDKSANEKLQQSIVDDANLKLVTLSRRLTLANRELEVVSDRVALSASRVQRQESLGEQGAISPDKIEQIHAEHLSAKQDQLRSQRAIVELDLEKQQLVAVGARAKIERVIRNLAADSQNERLHRLIIEKSVEQSQHVLSPKSGKVVRLGVRAGDVIGAGHSLLSIAAERAETEAWVYVSAHEAGTLRAGQEIELRLEAYPHQLFGTVTAAIFSVTRLAVLPRDVRAPIAVAGPVFEIKARISRQFESRLEVGSLPGIGAPFTADIIRHRYRLYEWLLRSRAATADPGRA